MIKKILIGILLLVIVATIGFFVFSVNFNIFEISKVSILKTECDYEGLRRAVLSKTNGNAVTNTSIEVSITKCDEINFQNLETIFIVDAQNIKSNDVNFKWKSFDTLTIKHNKNLRIFKQKTESESINPKIIFEYQKQ